MPAEPLPPDPDSVEKWHSLPQNKPSRRALPPAAGGLSVNRMLLLGIGMVMLLLIVISAIAGR